MNAYVSLQLGFVRKYLLANTASLRPPLRLLVRARLSPLRSQEKLVITYKTKRTNQIAYVPASFMLYCHHTSPKMMYV